MFYSFKNTVNVGERAVAFGYQEWLLCTFEMAQAEMQLPPPLCTRTEDLSQFC